MEKHFLLCTERSGSNLITKLLNAHSKICGSSTKHIMNPVFRNLFRYGLLNNTENWDKLLKDILNLYQVKFSVWKSSLTFDELKNNTSEGDYIGLINYIFDKEAALNNKNVVFVKENHIYEFFPYIHKYYPNSKYLYQVRDPRDVALSWKKNPTHKGGVVKAATQWKHDQQQYLKLYHFLNEENKVIKLRYEDLISNTPLELEKILNFFGLNFESDILNFYKDELTKENSKTQHAWNNLSKSVMSENSNKFLNELSEIEVQVIEKICYFEMKQLNYSVKSTENQLNKINDKVIEELKTKEDSLEYNPYEGVKENMKAKSIFYNF
jgi:hypothetical protein